VRGCSNMPTDPRDAQIAALRGALN
jgi:hypothetical protein